MQPSEELNMFNKPASDFGESEAAHVLPQVKVLPPSGSNLEELPKCKTMNDHLPEIGPQAKLQQ
jgi:hypothetical protein